MPKTSFEFSTPQRKVDATPEERAANALEFIAHYLDRIDAHLEQLAAAQTKSSLEGVRLELTAITEILKARLQG